MSAESRFLTLLRLLAHDPAAQGLQDDVAVLPVGGTRLILTSDTMVESVHYLPTDPPADIGWKLAAVNLSDLAAKGATQLVECGPGKVLAGLNKRCAEGVSTSNLNTPDAFAAARAAQA